MKMTLVKQWTFVDRTGWGSGPWDTEPDKAQWTDPATGLPCMIHRGTFGAWCGYVGVSEQHPAYGKDCYDVGGVVLVHANHPDNVWWLGFDCGHAFDLAPGLDAHHRKNGCPPMPDGIEVYRDMAYIRGECTQLAAQLAG